MSMGNTMAFAYKLEDRAWSRLSDVPYLPLVSRASRNISMRKKGLNG